MWYLGVAACLLASCATSLGFILMKLAYTMDEKRPEPMRARRIFGMLCCARWWSGFSLVVLGQPLNLAAFSLASQSVIIPLTGVTIIMNQVFAPILLHERLTRVDVLATGIIVVGAALCTAFGSHVDEPLSLSRLVELYLRPLFLVFELLIVSVLLSAMAALHMRVRVPPTSRALMFAFVAGGLAAQQNIMFKAVGELFRTAFSGSVSTAGLDRWPPYLIMAAAVCTLVTQLSFLSRGIDEFAAVKFVPIYNVSLIMQGVLLGSLYYDEFSRFTPVQWVFFPMGCAIVVAGVMLLALRPEEPGDEPIVSSVDMGPGHERRRSLLSPVPEEELGLEMAELTEEEV